MGRRVQAWERAGRPVMRSPGRPPVGRLEHRQRFWAAIARGVSSEAAAAEAGVSGPVGVRWFREGGGMPTVTLAAPSGRYLSCAEREEIALLRVAGCGVREVARRLGRSPSTISRELRRNAATRSGRLEYRATTAQWHADRRARRPKPAKLAVNDELRRYVQARLAGVVQGRDGVAVGGPDVKWIGRRRGRRRDRRWARSWSPGQISHRLRLDFPDDESMRVCHEAIYQSLFVSMKKGGLSMAVVVWGWVLRVAGGRAALISLWPAQRQDQATLEAGSEGSGPKRAVRRPDEKWSLPGRA